MTKVHKWEIGVKWSDFQVHSILLLLASTHSLQELTTLWISSLSSCMAYPASCTQPETHQHIRGIKDQITEVISKGSEVAKEFVDCR